jgi:hypothetical protein
MTNLADLLPAGGGQNNTDFVADGNVSAGAPVILTAAGKAKAVGVDAQSASFGSTADYDTDRAYYPALVHDTASGNDVVVYRDAGNSNYGTARVVSVSGSTLTFGTAVVFATVFSDYIAATYDASQSKILVVWRDDTNSQLKGIVGTVSGTSISFGSATQIGSYQGYWTQVAYNASANASVVSFGYGESGGYSNYPYGCVATISGTSVSFGTLVRIESTGREMSTATNIYDPSSTKNLIIWRTGYEGRAAVATVSGTSVSFGTHVDWTTNPNSPSATYDSVNQKIAICFTNLAVSNYVYYIVATISGTSVSFGTEAVVVSVYGYEIRGSFDTSVNKHVTTYTKDDGGDQYRFLVEGTMSGTTMSWTSPVSADNGNNAQYSGAQCYDPVAKKSILAITDNTTTTAYMRTYTASGSITNLTSTNLLGLAPSAISDTATGTINTWGSRCENSSFLGSALSAGSLVAFETSGSPSALSGVAFDANAGKMVIAYTYGLNGYAIVGTVSGTSASYGTAVIFQASAAVYSVNAAYDANAQKVVIIYTDGSNSDYPTAIVGTVSGTSISFGTKVAFLSSGAAGDPMSIAYDANAQKVVIGFRDTSNSNYGTGIVGTVSGTSISFGTKTAFNSSATLEFTTVYDSDAQKVAIGYRDAGNLSYGTAVVGTVSGTSISFGSPQVFLSAQTDNMGGCFDSTNNKVVFCYRDTGNSDYGTAIVGTISGTSISFGSSAVYNNGGSTSYNNASYDAGAGKVIISYAQGNAATIAGTVSGTSISFDTAVVLDAGGGMGEVGQAYDSTNAKTLIAFQSAGNSYHGYSATATYGDLPLTVASDYYVQEDGTISTTSTSPAQLIGKAIKTNQINIKDYTG